MGVNLELELQPVIGVIPAIVGWGIVKPVVVAWKLSRERRRYYDHYEQMEVQRTLAEFKQRHADSDNTSLPR